MIEKLERKVHEGQPFTPEEVLQLTENAPLDALCEACLLYTSDAADD